MSHSGTFGSSSGGETPRQERGKKQGKPFLLFFWHIKLYIDEHTLLTRIATEISRYRKPEVSVCGLAGMGGKKRCKNVALKILISRFHCALCIVPHHSPSPPRPTVGNLEEGKEGRKEGRISRPPLRTNKSLRRLWHNKRYHGALE